MAKQSPGSVYRQLLAAGFTPTQATLMTAVGGAESGWNDTARGDLSLQDNTWGPSFGLFQIRTAKAQTGTGSDRDITWLAASPAHQAQAAYDISHGGTDFTPWSVYTSGAYRKFLGPAQASTVEAQPVGLGSSVAGGIRTLTIQTLVLGLGLALVGVGLAQAVRPHAKQLTAKARKDALAAVLA